MDYQLILRNLGYELPIKNLDITPITVTGSTTVLSVTDTETGENSVYVTGKLRGLVHVSGSELIPKLDDDEKENEKENLPKKEDEKVHTETEDTGAVLEDTETQKPIIESIQHDVKDPQVDTNNQEEISEVDLDLGSTSEFLLELEDGKIERVPSSTDISKMNGGVIAMKVKNLRKNYGENIKILNTCVPEKYR
jgi:hypothetical protein|nr:MAG TPA: hypothetical protein [Caudoviricetes sp.]